ncbi:MAG: polyketide cyclase, partial [Verrucomicrobiaceae bacterium]|nr:polyketide cyclase [Verrucomicrobiaceae bacterium]
MFTAILLSVAVIIVLFVIVVTLQPAEFCISRSVDILAPQEAVFPYVDDVHKFQQWSPWAQMDPDSKVVFEGPPAGAGASFRWAGKKTGEGSMTNTASHPADFAKYRLEFLKPFKASNMAEFTLSHEGGQTTVNWSMTGTNGFLFKA